MKIDELKGTPKGSEDEKESDKAAPHGHRIWANKANLVQVKDCPHPHDAERHLVCIAHRKGWTNKVSRFSGTDHKSPWTVLRPVFVVERKRALLAALDLVGHLVRMEKENPSLIALSGVLRHVASMYGWDGHARELLIDRESFKARRAASKDEA